MPINTVTSIRQMTGATDALYVCLPFMKRLLSLLLYMTGSQQLSNDEV